MRRVAVCEKKTNVQKRRGCQRWIFGGHGCDGRHALSTILKIGIVETFSLDKSRYFEKVRGCWILKSEERRNIMWRVARISSRVPFVLSSGESASHFCMHVGTDSRPTRGQHTFETHVRNTRTSQTSLDWWSTYFILQNSLLGNATTEEKIVPYFFVYIHHECRRY
jgi:hypothetical protein